MRRTSAPALAASEILRLLVSQIQNDTSAVQFEVKLISSFQPQQALNYTLGTRGTDFMKCLIRGRDGYNFNNTLP